MNQPQPTEALSAYFDEEVSPSEREETAHRISESPAARRELAEIRRLSDILRQLPAEPAPAGLKAAVQNRLAAEQPAAPLAEPASKRSWGISVRTGVVLQMLTTAAVAVVLLTVWVPSWWNRPQPGDSNPSLAAKSQSPAEFPPRDAETFPVLKQQTEPRTKQPVHLGSEGDLLAGRQSAAANKLASPPPLPKPAETPGKGIAPEFTPSMAGASFGAAGGGFGGSGGFVGPPMRADPQVGQILELAQRQDGRVVIVEVTVVDVQKTLGQLQVLFAQHAVPPGNFQLNAAPPLALGDGAIVKAGSNYGLYVQSTSDQLSSTLAMLRREHAISGLEAKTTLAMNEIPVLIPSLGNRRAVRFAGKSPQTLAQSVQSYESRKDAAESLPKKMAPPKAPGEKSAPRDKPEPDRAQPQPSIAALDLSKLHVPENQDQAAGNNAGTESFQLMVQTPADDWLARKQAKPNAPASPKPDSNAGGRKRTETAPLAEIGKAEAERKPNASPIRLMFVFREQPAPKDKPTQ